jgi:hypothetical protein
MAEGLSCGGASCCAATSQETPRRHQCMARFVGGPRHLSVCPRRYCVTDTERGGCGVPGGGCGGRWQRWRLRRRRPGPARRRAFCLGRCWPGCSGGSRRVAAHPFRSHKSSRPSTPLDRVHSPSLLYRSWIAHSEDSAPRPSPTAVTQPLQPRHPLASLCRRVVFDC